MKKNKYRLLKTFVQGEAVKLSIDRIKYELTFIRVSNTHLILSTIAGEKEEIELDRITSIVL